MSTDSNLPPEPPDPEDDAPEETPSPSGDIHLGKLVPRPIDEELKDSYLTYSMSVIVSRALPDVRDGLKPSQRRILVAMSDLGLTPGSSTSKCAGIVGETMKRYHPHGDMAIYPTLVRMAQDWATRYPLVDKQGNFGSIAGLPAAAMRYTEARMSTVAASMMDDMKMDTVDFLPTYDEKGTEPSVLPSKFPNLLVNGSQGIAVGMATSIPPHNLVEVCDALIRLIDDPDISIDELMEIVPGPDFPTGNIVCGRAGLRRGYYTGRGTITLRARARIEEHGKGRFRIVVNEVPYQAARDRVEERIAELVNDGRIPGISASRNESDLKEPVRLVLELKKDADPEVVLAQLYQFSPLQDTFSLIFLALVDGKPRVMGFKELLEEFIRHREIVIRRRTLYLLAKARQRKHTVEGLLLALANIDEVIRTIRTSANQEEAKQRLMLIQTPAAMLRRALGDDGYEIFQAERGTQETYSLTPVQADAILRMTLGQLVNLEQEKLGGEHQELLAKIREYNRILSDRNNILDIIREDLKELKKKYPEPRRTEISGEEIGEVDLEDLIPEETMVVSISSNGYVKRTPVTAYRAQHRGGKGLTGAKTEEEDPIEHLFVASTHSYLMFFTNQGKVYWRKVYDLPQSARDSRGRAVVNLLSLQEGERITDCRAVRDFTLPDHYLVMATAKGLVEEDAAGGLLPPADRRHHRHQAPRRRPVGRRRRDLQGRGAGPGHGQGHGDPLQGVGRAAHGPRFQRRERHPPEQGRPGRGHGGGRSRGHAPDRLRQRLRQADPLRPEPGRRSGRRRAAEGERATTRRGSAGAAGAGCPKRPRADDRGRAERRGRGRAFLVAILPHAAPRRQGPARHQDHRAQRPGDRHRPHPRGRRIADDDRPRQDPADTRRRHQHHRPQYPRRALHEPRRRRHPGGRETRAQGRSRRKAEEEEEATEEP